MAVPKSKITRSKRNMRRAHDALKSEAYVEDKTTGELHRPHHIDLNAQFNLAVILSRGGTVKPDLREAYFWALAAQHRARTHPRGPLTVERLTKLVRQIRSALPHQAASQATRAATRLTGQPV